MRDFLDRVRTRAEARRTLADFPRKGICEGSLSPGAAFSIGTAIGQIPEPQISSINLLPNTYAPATGAAGNWVAGGTGAINAGTQWDANFLAKSFVAPLVTDFLEVAVATVPFDGGYGNNVTTFSAQLSVSGAGLPSTSVQLAIVWQAAGVPIRTDTLTVNPQSGQNLGVSASVSASSITTFSPTNAVQVFACQFTARAPIGADNTSKVRIFPSTNVAGANVFAGGFQLEQKAVASSFIPSPVGKNVQRPIGTTSRAIVDRSETPNKIIANYTLQDIIDNGTSIQVAAAGKTITLPVGGTAFATSGQWVDVYQDAGIAGYTLATSDASAKIITPSGTAVNSLALTTPCRIVNYTADNSWHVLLSAPAAGGASAITGTIAASQVAYGDAAANTIKGTAGFTFNGVDTLSALIVRVGNTVQTNSLASTGGAGNIINVDNVLNFRAVTAGDVGIKFPATQNPSSDANTLDDYEEGTWTPTDSSGAGLVFTSNVGTYEKIGRQVVARCVYAYPATGDASNNSATGLPFVVGNTQESRQGFLTANGSAGATYFVPLHNSVQIQILAANTAALSNAALSSSSVYGTAIYYN